MLKRTKFKQFIASIHEWGIVGAITHPWAVRRGFTREMVELCRITEKNHHEYISDYEHNSRWPFNRPYQGAVSDKLGLIRILHQYKECLPEYYFFIDQSGFLPLWDCPRKEELSTRVTADEFVRLLDEKQILLIKPTHSEVGIGVMVAKKTTTGYTLNDKPITVDALKQKVAKANNNIVTEYVIQHKYSNDICHTSLNTIRMLGVWNSQKKRFEIIRSFHRFGCNGNIVDNVGSGNGLLVWVDPETGILEREGLINENHQGDRKAVDIIHPDANIPLTGLQIPNYLEMKKRVLQIMNDNSYLHYIGFDVAITDDGFRIIEANGSSTPSVAQVKGGFLKDKRMVEMFNRIRPL